MNNIMIFMITVILFLGCKELETRRPINKQKQFFLKESAVRNKTTLSVEQTLFKKIIKQEQNLEFRISSKGFWYAFKKETNESLLVPERGDRVVFSYRIEDLNKNLLYDEKALGVVSFFIDQEDLIPALREGIKVMKSGDVAVFLFPSYLCYGYQGDGDKIGINQPLRFTIELLKLEKNKNP
jgi:gliding motility-associated peptidyl-prolyl isomerase